MPVDAAKSLPSIDPDASATVPASPGARALVFGLFGVVAVIYGPLVPELIQVWDTDPNYSHGFVVPLVSLAFAWMAWKEVGAPLRQTVDNRVVIAGLCEITFGLLLHVGVWFARNLFLDVLSLICVLRGMLLVVGGRDINRVYGFSVLFLIFMAPLPIPWYQPFVIRMQQLVSNISTAILDVCGVPVFREGYLIHLPGYTMEVAEACSGLRQLVAILALGVAIGHLSGRGRRFRWILGLSSIPIAIITNCIRVVLSGVILMFFGRQWAEGVFHTIEGLVIVAFSAGLLVAVAWGLTRIEDRSAGETAPAHRKSGGDSITRDMKT